MSYFSRLTDIVTCNLTELLAREAVPLDALRRIILEMEEGVSGARRSVATAAAAEARLAAEMNEHRTQIAYWTAKAREELGLGHEDQARFALLRKREIDDLIAGLQQQQAAATATREHLATTLRALEARLAETRRKQQALIDQTAGAAGPADTDFQTGGETGIKGAARAGVEQPGASPYDKARAAQIEAELDALRRELGGGPV